MNRVFAAALLAVGLAAGLAIAAWVAPSASDGPVLPAASGLGAPANVNERLAVLEAAVRAERDARQLLEDELIALYDEIEALASDAPAAARDQDEAEATLRRVATGGRPEMLREESGGTRLDALTAAGFSPSRAAWVLERESALSMEAMQARYEAMRAGEPVDPRGRMLTADSQLREELGDAEYEMYLAGNGRSTSVGVGQVFESSPAMAAGLKPGDRITHYDGERVFSTFDLTRQTMQGEAGENVVVNIVRDGAPMQIVLPRGPLGINTRGWR